MKYKRTFGLLPIIFVTLLLLTVCVVSGCKSAEISLEDKTVETIEKDIEGFRTDLKVLEMIRGKPQPPEIYLALDNVEQAIKLRDYGALFDRYSEVKTLVCAHLEDEKVIQKYVNCLEDISDRLNNKGAVDEAWRVLVPIMVKSQLKRIIIPEFSIGPPSTLVDAVDCFSKASRDYENSETPIERRGISFVLKLGTSQDQDVSGDQDDPFAGSGIADEIPVVHSIKAHHVSLYDAIEMVCDVTGYEFVIRGGVVMILPYGEAFSDD